MRAFTKRESEIKIYESGESGVYGAIWSPAKPVSGTTETLGFAEGLRVTDSKKYYEYQPVNSKTTKRIETNVNFKIDIDDLYLDAAWDDRFNSGLPFDLMITDDNEDESKEIVTYYRNCTIDSMSRDEGDYTKRGISITAERKEITYQGDTTSLIRTGAAVGKTSADFNSIYPWAGRQRVALDSSGVVQGVHHATDTDKWDDGSSVDWATYESNGWNCMVQVPKFWYRKEKVGGAWRFEIVPEKKNDYKVHPAFIDSDGSERDYYYRGAFEAWVDGNGRLRSLPSYTGRATPVQPTTDKTFTQFQDYATAGDVKVADGKILEAEQMQFFIEYATLHSQSVFRGIVDLDSGSGNCSQDTGYTLSLGNASGEVSISATNGVSGTCKPFSYRGTENFYGNVWEWVEGVVWSWNSGSPTLTVDGVIYPMSDTTSGTGYTTEFEETTGFFMPAIKTTGTELTYTTDYLWRAKVDNTIPRFGGCWDYGDAAGALCLYLNDPDSYSLRHVGARAAF